MLDSETVLYVIAVVLSLVFEYAPWFAVWWEGLDANRKQGYMFLLVSSAVFGPALLAQFGLVAWMFSGWTDVVRVWLVALGVNQGVHIISKR